MANVGGALKRFFHVHREADVEGGRFGFRPRLGRDIRRPTLTAASIFLAYTEANIGAWGAVERKSHFKLP
jgi:hypothetical protein